VTENDDIFSRKFCFGHRKQHRKSEPNNLPKIYHLINTRITGKSQADDIRNEVMSPLEKAQKLNADNFGFGDLIIKNLTGGNAWKTGWNEVFPQILVSLIIDAKRL
jgi:hypothetical protein